MAKPTIGFVGTGLMGHGMAKNVVEAGYPLVVMAHRKRDAVEDLIGRGADEVSTPAEMAARADVVVLCVTGSPEVEAVIEGEDGLLSRARDGMAIVDCSTSDPVSTRRLAEVCAEKGVALIDAPLSRTPKEAWEGTLDCMVGASAEDFERLKPLIDTWSGVVVHVGDVGTGHTMKLLNNFVAMGYGALYAEALALGRKAGLSPAVFDSVIAPGRMANGFYQTFMRWTLEGDEDAHRFAISNAAKDMRYLSNLALATGAVNPVQTVVRNAYAAMEAAGEGDRFVPMLAGFTARMNGLPEREE